MLDIFLDDTQVHSQMIFKLGASRPQAGAPGFFKSLSICECMRVCVRVHVCVSMCVRPRGHK